MYNYIIFFIIINIIILFYIYYINVKIQFLSSIEINDALYIDNYNYFMNMSKKNLNIRNITNIDNYLNNIYKHFYNLSIYDKFILRYNIIKAHNILNNLKYHGFNGSKLKNIPWLIACSKGTEYEFGYPHTRNKYIILNKNNIYDEYLYKTLIHERIHIYQKLFPNDIKIYLSTHNFKKISLLTENDRVNPDIDNYLYTKNNIIYRCYIEDDNNINCTNNQYIYEHPYEFMAYTIANNAINN